jgi:hypothetical protein
VVVVGEAGFSFDTTEINRGEVEKNRVWAAHRPVLRICGSMLPTDLARVCFINIGQPSGAVVLINMHP